jgi:acyl transferase domain-containing protein
VLAQWRIRPAAVVGHSSGEIAAAYAAGALTAEAAIVIAYYRGQVAEELSRHDQRGGMAAVGLSRKAIASYLSKDVTLACENSPSSVTISGDKDRLRSVMKQIQAESPDTFCRLLRVDVAYHSSRPNCEPPMDLQTSPNIE